MKKILDKVRGVLALAPVKALLKKDAKPIKKVLAGGIAAAVVFLAHRLGLHIPSKTVDDLASEFAGVVVAYIVR